MARLSAFFQRLSKQLRNCARSTSEILYYQLPCVISYLLHYSYYMLLHALALPVLGHTPLLLPPHEPTTQREERCIDSTPCYQNSKVQTNATVQPKQDLATALDNCIHISVVEGVGRNMRQTYPNEVAKHTPICRIPAQSRCHRMTLTRS